tara:strand:- start:167 stop:529 length:363 start_codon:yes stop_codon:yes gene_type:complete
VSIISGEEGTVKLFSEKLFTGSVSVDQRVAVPLFHDVANGKTIVDARISVQGLVILKHHNRALLGAMGSRTSEDDEVSFHDPIISYHTLHTSTILDFFVLLTPCGFYTYGASRRLPIASS